MELLDDAALIADGDPGAPLPVQAFGKDGDLPIDLEFALGCAVSTNGEKFYRESSMDTSLQRR